MKRLDEVEQIQYLKYSMRYEDNPKETEKLLSLFQIQKTSSKTKINYLNNYI